MSQIPGGDVAPVSPASVPHRAADDQEIVYFEGSPLLRGELGRALLAFLVGGALIVGGIFAMALSGGLGTILSIVLIVIGLLVLFLPFILVKTTRYRISNYRIDYEHGILSKRIETLELWHVDDIQFYQSPFDRMLGVGTLTVMSNDNTTPKLPLHGLPNPRPLFDSLKQRVIAVKRQRGVIKMDMG
ncbi:MAG: PH domain-containing protein [Tepidisphaeraceae bacterium]